MATMEINGELAETCAEALEELSIVDALKDQYFGGEDEEVSPEQIDQRIDAYGRAFQRLYKLMSMETPAQQERKQQAA